MAQKRRSGGGMGGGLMKQAFVGLWVLVIAGLVVGLARANDIKDPVDLWNYATSWSDAADECIGDAKEFGCSTQPPTGGPDSPQVPTEVTEEELDKLEKLLVDLPQKAPEEVKYERAEWRHWSDLNKDGCDTREEVLKEQGKKVKFGDDPCRPESGEWTSPYEGELITDPSSIDIDHVIPLSYAARHGGQVWNPATKEKFANDKAQLLATSASQNRSKGDKGPGSYMPPEVKYWCTYSQLWITTASKYALWIEPEDAVKLEEGLKSC